MFEEESNWYLRPGGGWTPAADVQELRRDERWYDAFERWRVEKNRAKPPGVPIDDTFNVAKPLPEGTPSDKKEYFNLKEKYLLRPEVRTPSSLSLTIILLTLI